MSEPVAAEQKAEDRPRDFAAFLLEHSRGRSHDELSQALRALVMAVAEKRKPGKLTYSVIIKPQPKIDGAVLVADEIKCSLPEFDRPESIFFATEAGELMRSDPQQSRLFD
jgi:hypothetical protein